MSLTKKPFYSTALCPAKGTKGLTKFTDWYSSEGLVLLVYFGNEKIDQIVGSAVMVAPGVAISAAHVVSDWADAVRAGQAGCMLTGFVKDSQVFWRPVRVEADARHDLAVITLECVSDVEAAKPIRLAHISTRTPKVGEQLMICGFRGGQKTFEHEGKDIELTATAYLSSGAVTNIHHTHRDRFLIAWPAYEVDCVTVGGMSGGPAFDSDGYLVGVLGKSWEGIGAEGKEEPQPPSYVWPLWPILRHPIVPVWPPQVHNGQTSLVEMNSNLCSIERREAVQGDVDLGDGRKGVGYQTWDAR